MTTYYTAWTWPIEYHNRAATDGSKSAERQVVANFESITKRDTSLEQRCTNHVEACERFRRRDFFRRRFAEALWFDNTAVSDLLQFVCVAKHGESITVGADRCGCIKVLLHTRSATLTRRAVANSRPRGPKQPADFAEAPRGGDPALQASAYAAPTQAEHDFP